MGGNRDKTAGLAGLDDRYKPDAYSFVLKVVERSVERLETPRHLSAREVLAGVVELAEEEFGGLGEEVLNEWGVRDASDVGKIVYIMIDAGLLAADEKDSPDDFEVNFDLFPAENHLGKRKTRMPKID